MNFRSKAVSVITAACLAVTGFSFVPSLKSADFADAAESSTSATDTMNWGAVQISGGGFVSGIVTGKSAMYARTDVGGAYKYNYQTQSWDQLMAFITEADRGLLSVDAMAIDPTDDNTAYFLCGCAYFSNAKTSILRTTDGGKTFSEVDVTDMIQVMGNGDGRHCGESIAVDPDNPNIIYCGGDVCTGDSALIMSKDGGKTWSQVSGYGKLGYFKNSIKWPTWTDHMVNAVSDGAYNTQNGVASIRIYNGKVYVATSITGAANVAVADVGSDNFTTLSADLPTTVFPSRINQDCNGNLLITYVAGLAFGNGSGGVYKYDPKTGKTTNISPVNNSFGACVSAPDNANELIATTCAVWSSQSWSKDSTCWGEWLYRSEDGGTTWTTIYPGKMGEYKWNKDTGEMVQEQLYDYLNDGGCSWIRGKAIHWSGSIVLDPKDPTRALVTSGNGVFKWDKIWTDDPEATFHAKGIEEVVALDMTSVPGGKAYSAIGDYDGFIHSDVDQPGVQYVPNMGSTSAIAYCPQNPKVMVRVAENQNDTASGFYSLDAGTTWTKMSCSAGGKAAITEISDGKYRIFKSEKDSGDVKYSDDFGATWTACTGIASAYGSKTTQMLVETNKPNVVYAYATYYNSSWFYSKKEAELSDANYTLYVSTDYGKTFTGTQIAKYDQCDSCGRIAYLGEDNLVVGAGYYGAYYVTGSGKNVEKLNVFYCKSIGYGAPEKKGDVNTLYMWGKPFENDKEGVYRSQDSGKTWVLINSDYQYGGTGNGNFLVGDMNTFGTVYMSTVGAGIVYGKIASDSPNPTTQPTTAQSTTVQPTTSGAGVVYGDANCDGKVDISDVVAVRRYAINSVKYPLTAQGVKNADVQGSSNGLNAQDAVTIQQYVLGSVKALPVA